MNKFIIEFFQDHPKGVPSPYQSKWPPTIPFTKGTYHTFPDSCSTPGASGRPDVPDRIPDEV